jgi:hypothetical protein
MCLTFAYCTHVRATTRASCQQGPIKDLFLARRKGDVNFTDFINVVGPVYLEFAALGRNALHTNTRFQTPTQRWRMGQQ